MTHEFTRLSKDTIDSVLRHWDIGRAKDLSAPPRKFSSSLVEHQVTRPQQKRLFSVTSILRIFPHFSSSPPHSLWRRRITRSPGTASCVTDTFS